MVLGKESSLQFAHPVEKLRKRQRGVARQMPLELQLIELTIVKAAELPRRATKRPDQRELRSDDIDHHPEACFPRELEAVLRFAFNLRKPVSGCQTDRVDVVAAVCCERQIVHL